MEVGCGNGSNVVPLLEASGHCPAYKIHACDFAAKSVDMVKNNEKVMAAGSRANIFLHDLSSDNEILVPEKSIDCVICTFVLSALPKERMEMAVSKMAKCLKPGGEIFFRDYGRHDMAQLRFKPNRVVGENFYSRG